MSGPPLAAALLAVARPTRASCAPALVALALTGASCSSPTPRPDAARDAAAAGLSVTPNPLDLGLSVPGAAASGTALVRNATHHDITLERLELPCECTSSELGLPRELAPGATLELPIRLDLEKLPRGGLPPDGAADDGLVERTVGLVTSDGRETSLDVRLAVSADLRLDPPRLDLGIVPVGGASAGELKVLPGPARDAVAVLDARLDAPDSRVETVAEGDGVSVRLLLAPADAPGIRETTLRLVTDVPGLEALAVPVTVDVRPLVSVRPEAIDTDAATPGRPLVVNLVVKRIDGGTLEVLGIGNRTNRVRVELLPTTPAPEEQRIRVVVPVRPYPESVDDLIIIDTNVAKSPRLTVPVHVRASAPPASGGGDGDPLGGNR